MQHGDHNGDSAERASQSSCAPSILLRAVSLVVIAVCLTFFSLGIAMLLEKMIPSNSWFGARFIGSGVQALCQYLAVYRRQRWAALIAALLPLVAGGSSIGANYGKWIDAFRIMHPLVFVPLLPQMAWLLTTIGLSVLMFRWRAQLAESDNDGMANSAVAYARTPRVPLFDRWTIGLYLLTAGILIASFWLTPMNSGAPAAFGSIVQPAVWFMACIGALFGAGLTAVLGRFGSLGSRGALAGAIVAVAVGIAQIAFALLGPDI
jgi:hypothetical protein